MKFIHVADIHASRERLPQTLSILKTLTERAKKGDIDFIIFAGDFWDSTITATKGSGFSDIISAIRTLESFTHLYFIYGTPSHEPNGSLDAFQSSKTTIVNEMKCVSCEVCHIICIPEPRRSEYITDSIQKTNDLINSTIEKWIKKTAKWHEGKKEYLPVLGAYEYDKPLIVVYHGEVKGAVYQNGVSASSPTAISKEQLQSLNADYYALGHIHLPQEVFENAWYPGSACPKNFGEPHDGHYNLVTIEDGKTKVEQVSFGLPTYVTFYQRPDNFIEGNSHQNEKTNFRFIFDCTKEERKQMNLKTYADETKERLRALSVKIEPNVIEGEAIQTSEVSKRKSIVEKMTAYAKEKGLKIPKYAKEILQDIQDGTLAKLAYPQHSFELLSLSLRGAIGIRDGQGKEEIEINFEKYEDGVICLSAPHGHGKSTLIENCHPYPKMLSRKGTLQDHFYLKDSHRILVYKDENGLFYKISMLIDGKTANGKVSYFVVTSKNGEVWKSVEDVDGSSESYKKWVNENFGSIDVYLRTAFFAKEPTKDATDISDTTKSERMEFLSKLAGTDQLKEVSLIAREGAKSLIKEVEKIETEISVYSNYEDFIEQNDKNIETWKKELEAQEELITITKDEVSELKVADAEYQKNIAIAESNKLLYEQYQNQKNETESKCKSLEIAISNYDKVSQIKEKKLLLAETNKKIPEFQKKTAAKKSEIDDVESEITKVRKEREQTSKKFHKLEIDIKVLKQQIVPVYGFCPTCGERLSAEKYAELSSVVKENESKLHQLIAEQNKYIVPEEKDDWTLAPLLLKKETLKDELGTLDCALIDMIDSVSDCNNFLEQWSEFDEYSDKSKEDLEGELSNYKVQIEDLNSKLNNIVFDSCIEDVSQKLKETEKRLSEEINRKAELIASIKTAEKSNEQYKKELASVESKKFELKILQVKITAYNFIEDAFSNKGIPAVELRESAPEIANIANMILSESYGNKFTIRFGSSSDLNTKKKADEDFNIIICDNDNNDEKPIDWISSGEKIWIKQALFYAFSIVQMNRTGFNFKTRFIDESDGSIDGAARPKYLKMVETAHKYSNSRITLMITHSQEIKDIAQQIIEI